MVWCGMILQAEAQRSNLNDVIMILFIHEASQPNNS